jgi:MFS family permease
LICLSVFVSGAVLMAVEILAFLINATTFGAAWREMTAVIAVFLAAMSIGYWVEGLLGDRVPRPAALVGTMIGAAVFVALILWIASPVKDAVFSSRLLVQWYGLIAAAALYFVLWNRRLGGQCLSMTDYVAMPEAHQRGADRRRASAGPLMSTTLRALRGLHGPLVRRTGP